VATRRLVITIFQKKKKKTLFIRPTEKLRI